MHRTITIFLAMRPEFLISPPVIALNQRIKLQDRSSPRPRFDIGQDHADMSLAKWVEQASIERASDFSYNPGWKIRVDFGQRAQHHVTENSPVARSIPDEVRAWRQFSAQSFYWSH